MNNQPTAFDVFQEASQYLRAHLSATLSKLAGSLRMSIDVPKKEEVQEKLHHAREVIEENQRLAANHIATAAALLQDKLLFRMRVTFKELSTVPQRIDDLQRTAGAAADPEQLEGAIELISIVDERKNKQHDVYDLAEAQKLSFSTFAQGKILAQVKGYRVVGYTDGPGWGIPNPQHPEIDIRISGQHASIDQVDQRPIYNIVIFIVKSPEQAEPAPDTEDTTKRVLKERGEESSAAWTFEGEDAEQLRDIAHRINTKAHEILQPPERVAQVCKEHNFYFTYDILKQDLELIMLFEQAFPKDTVGLAARGKLYDNYTLKQVMTAIDRVAGVWRIMAEGGK